MGGDNGGQRLQCDECGELFPERPRRGWNWNIRKEAAAAGWQVGGRERHDRDVCPKHGNAP